MAFDYTPIKAHINIDGIRIGKSYFANKIFVNCEISKIFELIQILYPCDNWTHMECESIIHHRNYVDINIITRTNITI